MFTKNKTGWIGIDIGTNAVKLAQVARRNGKLEVVAKAVVQRDESWSDHSLSDKEPRSSADELEIAKSLFPEFKGRKAAASISMAVCGLHRFDEVLGNTPGQEGRIRQALEVTLQQSASSLQYDAWNSRVSDKSPEVSQVLCMQRTWGDQICEDITKIRWSCQLIDGMPHAFSRAVQMIHPNDKRTPFAALNLGSRQSEFYAIISGSPVYVRTLKNCGYSSLLSCVCHELNITEEEAQFLLQEHPIHQAEHKPLSDTSEILREIADNFLKKLLSECTRTLHHISNQRHPLVPEKIYLFGGGATVAGIDSLLEHLLKIDVSVWQCQPSGNLESQEDTLPDCLFGPAITLSALGLEQS